MTHKTACNPESDITQIIVQPNIIRRKLIHANTQTTQPILLSHITNCSYVHAI